MNSAQYSTVWAGRGELGSEKLFSDETPTGHNVGDNNTLAEKAPKIMVNKVPTD